MISLTDSINSVGSTSTMPARSSSEQYLTENQQNVIAGTLANFDVENLSASDALVIVDSFSQAGIQPGVALEKSMAELGFDAKTVGELANVEGNNKGVKPPPPAKQNSDEITLMVDYLAALLEEKMAESGESTLSDEDKQSILLSIKEKFDIEDGDSIINTSA